MEILHCFVLVTSKKVLIVSKPIAFCLKNWALKWLIDVKGFSCTLHYDEIKRVWIIHVFWIIIEKSSSLFYLSYFHIIILEKALQFLTMRSYFLFQGQLVTLFFEFIRVKSNPDLKWSHWSNFSPGNFWEPNYRRRNPDVLDCKKM